MIPRPIVRPRTELHIFTVTDHLRPLRSRPISCRYFAGALTECRFRTFSVFQFNAFSFRFLVTMPAPGLGFYCYAFSVCPSRCSPVLSVCVSKRVLCLISSFRILSLQMISSIRRCHLWCAASRPFMLATIILHVSAISPPLPRLRCADRVVSIRCNRRFTLHGSKRSVLFPEIQLSVF